MAHADGTASADAPPPDVSFEASGLAWSAEPESAEIVRREIAERLDQIESIPGVRLLKRNMVRAVYRVPLSDGRAAIVKRFRVSGPRDWMKYAVRDSRALTEWRIGRALHEAGIPTPTPLAYAERHAGGVLRDAALVTREIPDASHLNAFVGGRLRGSPERDRLRAALFDELARFVRRMHDQGFIHHDFHGGNLLVSGPPQGPALHVIDLHTATRRTSPSERARWADLMKLLHSMLTCSTPAERVRICEVYHASGSPSETRLRELIPAGRVQEVVEPILVRMERDRVRSRTDRSLVRSSKFEITQRDGRRIHHLRTIDPDLVLALLPLHAADVEARRSNVLKDGGRSALTRQTLGGPGGRRVIVKEYRGRGFIDRAKNAVRTPRGVAAWVAGHGLIVRGFDAAEPLALVLHGRGPGLRGAWLVMEDLGDGTRADLVVLARFASPDLSPAQRAEKRAMVQNAADLFRRLHAGSVYHGDLKAVNLFVRGGTPDGRLSLADYDRVEFDHPVPARRRVKNLAQLSASVPVCISLSDRLRFFRRYAQDAPDTAARWKDWFRRVSDECRSKIVVRTRPIE